MSVQRPQEQPPLRPRGTQLSSMDGFGSLQFILWTLLTITVLGVARRHIRAALLVGEPVELNGLVIYCLLVGVIGMLVITILEMRLEPWRFYDDRDA